MSKYWNGFYWKSKNKKISLGLFAHSLQCDQRWIYLLRVGKRIIGYRTLGDATPDLSTYYESGFYWPWASRLCSGRK